jgi:hypothetical protein
MKSGLCFLSASQFSNFTALVTSSKDAGRTPVSAKLNNCGADVYVLRVTDMNMGYTQVLHCAANKQKREAVVTSRLGYD